MYVCVCSQQPVPEKLQIRVNRVSMAAYEALHYDKDQLKEACESGGLKTANLSRSARELCINVRACVCVCKSPPN